MSTSKHKMKISGVAVTIVSNSTIAYFAAIKLKSKRMAIVFGTYIHLYGVSIDEFLKDKKWVIHEMTHVHQYQRLGTVQFICSYLIESILKGYWNNKYEVEARRAANENF
jgi:hypothetical protein